MSVEWDIKTRGESCRECEKAFVDKEAYYTALNFGEEGYERSDHCDACWEKLSAKETFISYWRGLFTLPPEKPQDPLQKENAEVFLRQLIEEKDPTKTNVVYILAAMLERKKVLIEKDVETREDGTKIRIYQHKTTEETFLIVDPQLRLAELEPVQEEVVIMLGGTPPSRKQAPSESDSAPEDEEIDEEDEFEDEEDEFDED